MPCYPVLSRATALERALGRVRRFRCNVIEGSHSLDAEADHQKQENDAYLRFIFHICLLSSLPSSPSVPCPPNWESPSCCPDSGVYGIEA